MHIKAFPKPIACIVFILLLGFFFIPVYAESAEDTEEYEVGDDGVSYVDAGSLSSQSNTENVTFILDLGDIYTTEPYIIYFCEIGSYQEYYVEFYASSGYQTTVKLPVGAYYFTSGGPENDYMSIYTITEPTSFTVSDGEDLYIGVTIRSRGETLTDTEDEEDEEESVEEIIVETQTETEGKSKTPWYVYLILSVILIGGGIGIIYFIFKRSKNELS